jgi:hypothetical protein
MGSEIHWRVLFATSIGAAGAIGLVQPSWAERHEESHEEHFHGDIGRFQEHGGRHGERFRGDIGRFHDHDWGLWRGGHWEHGDHDGRFGWWWIAGGAWYFYPAPVYPYPDPYVPPVAVITPPAQPAVQGLPPQPKYWYHCTSPNGYYPYVASCQGGWQAVPATPGQSPVAGATPPAK